LLVSKTYFVKQEMSLKTTNGAGFKKGENSPMLKYLYINLTQMTEKLEWSLLWICGQLFWPTLFESKWCLQISFRRFITCVKTDRGRKILQVLSCVHTKHMLKSITLNDIFKSKVVALYNLYYTNKLVVAKMGNNKYNLGIK